MMVILVVAEVGILLRGRVWIAVVIGRLMLLSVWLVLWLVLIAGGQVMRARTQLNTGRISAASHRGCRSGCSRQTAPIATVATGQG